MGGGYGGAGLSLAGVDASGGGAAEGRTPPHLSSLPGEIGGNPDPFKVSLGWGSDGSSPSSASHGAALPPRRDPQP